MTAAVLQRVPSHNNYRDQDHAAEYQPDLSPFEAWHPRTIAT
jgi:hypothetical protein